MNSFKHLQFFLILIILINNFFLNIRTDKNINLFIKREKHKTYIN